MNKEEVRAGFNRDVTIGKNVESIGRWRFVRDVLGKQYVMSPDAFQYLSENDIPSQEIEIRKALVEWLFGAFVPYSSLSWFDRFFDRKRFMKTLQKLERADEKLMTIAFGSPEHAAALKRIISIMPRRLEQKQCLIEMIENRGRQNGQRRNAADSYQST